MSDHEYGSLKLTHGIRCAATSAFATATAEATCVGPQYVRRTPNGRPSSFSHTAGSVFELNAEPSSGPQTEEGIPRSENVQGGVGVGVGVGVVGVGVVGVGVVGVGVVGVGVVGVGVVGVGVVGVGVVGVGVVGVGVVGVVVPGLVRLSVTSSTSNVSPTRWPVPCTCTASPRPVVWIGAGRGSLCQLRSGIATSTVCSTGALPTAASRTSSRTCWPTRDVRTQALAS